MNYSEISLDAIKFLEASGKKPDSFSEAFTYIHHFRNRGGDASLEGFREHCQNHEIEGETNINVYRRLEHIRKQVEDYLSLNPDRPGISSIKYLSFAKNAVNDIPF